MHTIVGDYTYISVHSITTYNIVENVNIWKCTIQFIESFIAREGVLYSVFVKSFILYSS